MKYKLATPAPMMGPYSTWRLVRGLILRGDAVHGCSVNLARNFQVVMTRVNKRCCGVVGESRVLCRNGSNTKY